MINSVSNNTRIFASSQAAPSNGAAAPAAPAQAAPAESFTPSAQPAPANQQPPAQQAPTNPPAEEPPAPPAQPELKKWTVMLWSASDNNLYRFLQADIDEAERVGSTPQMNVLVQTDHGPRGGNVVRMKLETDNTSGVKSPVLEDRGPGNTASPEELADFIKWGKKNYPAENYFVIISDHGAGWQGAAHDESHHGWMKIGDIEKGLQLAREGSDGAKIDVLGFDCCLMASTEVAHQLKGEADFLVASQEVEGGAGWQYNRVLSEQMLAGQAAALAAVEAGGRVNFTPRDFAANVVSMAQGVQHDLATMSAIDLSKIDKVTAATDLLGRALLTTPASNQSISSAANQTQGFYEFKDLVDFAEKAAAKSGDAAVGIAAEAVKNAVADSMVAEQHSSKYPGAHGLTIELTAHEPPTPPPAQQPPAQQPPAEQPPAQGSQLVPPRMPEGSETRIDFGKYADTKFAQDTQFDEAVRKFRSY